MRMLRIHFFRVSLAFLASWFRRSSADDAGGREQACRSKRHQDDTDAQGGFDFPRSHRRVVHQDWTSLHSFVRIANGSAAHHEVAIPGDLAPETVAHPDRAGMADATSCVGPGKLDDTILPTVCAGYDFRRHDLGSGLGRTRHSGSRLLHRPGSKGQGDTEEKRHEAKQRSPQRKSDRAPVRPGGQGRSSQPKAGDAKA